MTTSTKFDRAGPGITKVVLVAGCCGLQHLECKQRSETTSFQLHRFLMMKYSMKMRCFACFPSWTGKIHPFHTGTTIVEIKSEFRFGHSELPLLAEALQIPQYFVCSNGLLLLEWKGCSCCWSYLHICVAWATWYQDLDTQFQKSVWFWLRLQTTSTVPMAIYCKTWTSLG